jgi:hypothetical protein
MSLTMFGYPARLVIDLPDGDDVRTHDVSRCVQAVGSNERREGGFWINPSTLLNEIEVELRTRRRWAERDGALGAALNAFVDAHGRWPNANEQTVIRERLGMEDRHEIA